MTMTVDTITFGYLDPGRVPKRYDVVVVVVVVVGVVVVVVGVVVTVFEKCLRLS